MMEVEISSRVKAVAVRVCLLLHFGLVVWRVTESKTQWYWLLLFLIVPFLLEGIFTVVRRRGFERERVSGCYIFYLAATLPGIWLLELHKTEVYQSTKFPQLDHLTSNGAEILVRLIPAPWDVVVEELTPLLVILGLWALPHWHTIGDRFIQLLVLIGIASDIMELFSLVDEDPKIRHDTILTCILLAVWSLSLLQFTLPFATVHRRSLRVYDYNSGMGAEIVATFMALLMQDGPFLAVRLYTMIHYTVINYSLVFFTAKNVLIILFLVYKIFRLRKNIYSCRFCKNIKNEESQTSCQSNRVDLMDDEFTSVSQRPHSWFVSEASDWSETFERKDCRVSFDLSVLDPNSVRNVQEVSEGPATPTESSDAVDDMHKIQDNTGTRQPSEDTQGSRAEKGMENPAFEPSLRSSREEGPTDGNESLASLENPSRTKSLAQSEGPDSSHTSHDGKNPSGKAGPGKIEPPGCHPEDPGLNNDSPGKEGVPNESKSDDRNEDLE